MNSIRIRKRIDSETLRLPELAPLIGHTVDIVIQEPSATITAAPEIVPGTGDWDVVLEAAKQLTNYDYGTQHDQDDCDVRDAKDRLR